jgi:membrane associated rhomboid family serine protease
MIPLRDNIPHSQPPYVNYALIAFTTLAFFWELSFGPEMAKVTALLGFVPAKFVSAFSSPQFDPATTFTPLVTALFLHGGWLHLLGNMWFLFIFGDNVEDVLGHWRYLLFYLVCGVGANLIYLMFTPFSAIPLIGASGAIAGVMGAYFNLFPGARILTLFVLVFIPLFFELPAYFFLGLWFMMQFLLGSVATVEAAPGTGGVGWWAHVGGFVVGILLLHRLAPYRVRNLFRFGQR